MEKRSSGLGTLVGVLFLVWLVQQGPAPQARPAPQAARPAPARTAEPIPAAYLALYRSAASTCPRLDAATLAAIGDVESDHGRASAPGVRSGLNRAGCCAGPMQFNLTDGPPSTWARWRRPGDDVYSAADAIPAAARKLCADGLRGPPGGTDPCPQVAGSAALHRAVFAYNHACWYVAEVVAKAARYRAKGSA